MERQDEKEKLMTTVNDGKRFGECDWASVNAICTCMQLAENPDTRKQCLVD